MWPFKKKRKPVEIPRELTEEEKILAEAIEKFELAYEEGRMKEIGYSLFSIQFSIAGKKFILDKNDIAYLQYIEVYFGFDRIILFKERSSDIYLRYSRFMRKLYRFVSDRDEKKKRAAIKKQVSSL